MGCNSPNLAVCVDARQCAGISTGGHDCTVVVVEAAAAADDDDDDDKEDEEEEEESAGEARGSGDAVDERTHASNNPSEIRPGR